MKHAVSTDGKRPEAIEPQDCGAIGWARVAGLVQLHADGSWALTKLGMAGLLALERTSTAFDPPVGAAYEGKVHA